MPYASALRASNRLGFQYGCKTPIYHWQTGANNLQLGNMLSMYVLVYCMSPTGSTAGLGARNVPVFNGTNQYGQLATAQTYTGDFFIEIDMVLPTVLPAGNRALYGGAGGAATQPNGFAFYIDGASGNIAAQIATTAGGRYDISVSATPYLGGTHTARLGRSAGIWTLLIDGVQVDTFDSNPFGVIDQSVSFIGRWGTQLNYSGSVYNYMDSVGNYFPMDDGFNANPVMRNIGSGADGTYVGMNSAAWSFISPAVAPLTPGKWQVLSVRLDSSDMLVNGAVPNVDLYVYQFMYGGNTYTINMGEPVLIDNVAVLDGLTQQWQLSSAVTLGSNYRIEFESYYEKPTANKAYLGGDNTLVGDPSNFVYYENTVGAITAQLPLTNGTNAVFALTEATHGLVTGYHTIVLERNGDVFTQTVGAATRSDSRVNFNNITITQLLRWATQLRNDNYIRNLKIWNGGVLIVDLPLTDKAAGATQLGVNGTSVDATCVNYTADVWRGLYE